ncbi:RNA recognition motif-containing protein [Toxoplasma gondii ME49]|uniref:RNA binding protein, putative n=14 Tax=Toxoplasma gondii TaxID=5811 RepID=B9PYD2_TOXGV|nr:RNA recognition motif-containing protein [Toxoplasma gondii ME49]EPR57692.1 RNA recognition motif-containing protein [Toxoplasma gondii GT1]ESS29191.1 RNA recognition motif-containing protein [Toxoplasma gondii VEG]KAF4646185.1 RNA recognition motif-containing protein [Toxoplasma gondii]KFG35374.1 RNA recognition motif-containing protein [Toxoplasma gondii p89]KFG37361.1 RNA recognition motif-containing protein [Toxoplasma gondii GAB2-2007-GAL-DOM2]KFG46704.1 RNA recognition motif-containi|eukprot:XP_002370240.1 RNA recognition motif-containing protein [Toxoplasma gondii ME49]
MLGGASGLGAAPTRALYSTANVLYIKNLSPLVTEDHIRQIFTHCGEILNIGFKAYLNNPAQRYCVLEFKDSAGITAASQLNNTPLLNVPMTVTVVEPAGGGTFIAAPEALAGASGALGSSSLEALAKQAALNVQHPVGQPALAPGQVGEGVRQLQQLQQQQLQQFEANGALGAGAQLATAGAVAALGGQAGGAAAFGAMPLNSQMSVVEIAMQNHLSNLQAVQSAALQAKILAEKKKTELGLGVSIGPGAGGLLPAAASLVTGCPHKETELQQLGRTVFVENFPEEYEKEELHLLLRDFGKISNLRFGQHPEKGSKFAVVEFETAEEAQFLRGMDAKPIGNLTLTIKESQSVVNFRDPDGVLFDVPPPPILAVLKQQQTPEAQQEALQSKLKEVKYAKLEIEEKFKAATRPKRESRSRGVSSRRRRRNRSSSGSVEAPRGRSLSPGRRGSVERKRRKEERPERGRDSSRSLSAGARGGSGAGRSLRGGGRGERRGASRSPRRSLERRGDSRGRLGSEGAGRGRERAVASGARAPRPVEARRSISRSPDMTETRRSGETAQKDEVQRDGSRLSPREAEREGDGCSDEARKHVSRSASREAGRARKPEGRPKNLGVTAGPEALPSGDKKPTGPAAENGLARCAEASESEPESPGLGRRARDTKERDGRGGDLRSPRRRGTLSNKRDAFSCSSRSPSADRRRALRETERKRPLDASASRSPSGPRQRPPGAWPHGPQTQRGADPRSSSRSPEGRSGARRRLSPFSKKKEDRDLSRERGGRAGPSRLSVDGRRGGPERRGRRSGSRRHSSLSDSDRSPSFSPGRPQRVPGPRGPSGESGLAYGRPRPRLSGRPDAERGPSPFSRRRRRSVSRSGDRNSVEDGRLSRGGSRGRRPGPSRRPSDRLEPGEEAMRDRDDDYSRGGFPGPRIRGDRRGGAPYGPGGRRPGSREPSFGRELHPGEKGDGPARSGARVPVRGRGTGAQLAETASTAWGGPGRMEKGREDGPFGMRGEGPRGRGRQPGRRRLGRRDGDSGDEGGRDARMDRYKSQSRSLSEDSDSASPVSGGGVGPGVGGSRRGSRSSGLAGREALEGEGAPAASREEVERNGGARAPQGAGEFRSGSAAEDSLGAKDAVGPKPMNALCGGRPGTQGSAGTA